MRKHHLWVLLSALPLPLWIKELIMDIANTFGRFVEVEENFPCIFDKRMARVLVELDMSNGLMAEIDIICNERTITQKLDYLNAPFRCKACHEIGNL